MHTTGCLKLIYVEDLHVLAGIAPPDIRIDVCARMERTKQMEKKTHSLFGNIPAKNCQKLRKNFLTSVKSSYFPPKVIRCNKSQMRSSVEPCLGLVGLNEEPAKGYESSWLTWRCLNRLRTGYTGSNEQRNKTRSSRTLSSPVPNMFITRSSHVPHTFLTRSSHVPHTFLTRYSHVPHTFLTRSSHVPHTFLTRSSHVPHTFFTRSSHVPHTFLTRFSHVSHTFLTSSSQVPHKFLTRSSSVPLPFLIFFWYIRV